MSLREEEDGYWQSELDEETNKLPYTAYKKRLLGVAQEVKEDRKKYAKNLDFWVGLEPVLDKHTSLGKLQIVPELNMAWEQIKGIQDEERCREIIKNWMAEESQFLDIYEIQKCICQMSEEKGRGMKQIWFATTKKGIEIHPGLIDDEEPDPLILADDSVHALLAGRTGSGKSNALHAIISGLMYEYAPWELNINLADFKILEMSKYGNSEYKAPHVSKIAATDSMEYVVSIMYDMYEKMVMRQKVFSALGFQKLADFRDFYSSNTEDENNLSRIVVLPREILIVDEFQQMYELATPKQTDMINQLIKMITKLGRATGFHLFFASQSMSGTVRGDILANFKLRLCLPASDEVSSAVLGNRAAAELTENRDKSRGYLIANAEGGNINSNIEFRVPLVDEKEGELKAVLEENAVLAERIGYQKNLDFYNEDTIRPMFRKKDAEEQEQGEGGRKISSLEEDAWKFYKNTRAAVAANEEIDDYLLLGDSCVFARHNGKKSTLEYAPLRNGERRNILCVADSVYQRAYLMGLLGIQYSIREKSRNFVFHGEPVVRDILFEVPLLKELFGQEDKGKTPFDVCNAEQLMGHFETSYMMRSTIWEFIQLPESDRTKEMLAEMYLQQPGNQNSAEKKRFDEEKYLAEKNRLAENLWKFYQQGLGEDGKFRFGNLKAMNYWISGFHMQSDLMEEWRKRKIFDKMKKCTNLGIRFIFFGTKAADLPAEVLKNFEYRFLITNDEMNFSKLGLRKPKEYKENVLWFQAKNETLNRQKPGLYILEQDQKMVKMFDVDWKSPDEAEKDFFNGIE